AGAAPTGRPRTRRHDGASAGRSRWERSYPMSNRARLRSSARLRLGAAALFALALAPAATAGLISQTSSLPLTTTDFSPSNSAPGNPLVFQQFDTQGGARTLDGVTLTVHAMIQNQYGMQFTTPATITDSAFTGNPTTTGPSITVYQPDGKTPLLTARAS